MNEITIKKLIELINSYNSDAIKDVKRAYVLADILHKGQIRNSGEPYIIHPLNVAYTLAQMHADCDTLCAGLLHDTLEDTEITKEEIEKLFNKDVANLVYGVTKLSKMNFSTKEEKQSANTRKIITGIMDDVRIIIIKLADRLHNMRTLEHKSPFKQKENSTETLEIFAPLAYYIGAYQLKNELEDLSLKYLRPEIYNSIKVERKLFEEEVQDSINEMLKNINEKLTKSKLNFKINIRTKNIYGVYKKLQKGYKFNEIYDLISLKIIVENEIDCYIALGAVHNCYKTVPGRIKDYICIPKTNMYQSLHTTVFGPNETLVQIQIRTKEMDKTAKHGLTALWDTNKGEARNVMQKELREKFQFIKSLNEINKMFTDNQSFVEQVKAELFTNKVYAYTPNGNIIELPLGATIIDYAYAIDPENADKMVDAIVNNRAVSPNYKIQNNDRIKIITSTYSEGPKKDWKDIATTSYAKKRIKEYSEKNIISV